MSGSRKFPEHFPQARGEGEVEQRVDSYQGAQRTTLPTRFGSVSAPEVKACAPQLAT